MILDKKSYFQKHIDSLSYVRDTMCPQSEEILKYSIHFGVPDNITIFMAIISELKLAINFWNDFRCVLLIYL